MKLSSILKDYPVLSVSDRPIAEAFLSGQMEQQIHSIDYDSRRVSAGSLFFCLPGAHADGHRFAPLAYAAGCRAFVCSRRLVSLPEDAVQILVENPRHALACLSASFYGRPAEKLTVIGITGTSVAVLTFGVILLFAHMMSSPLTAFTRKMQDTTVRNLHEESFEIEQIPFREIQILYTEFFRMRQRLDTMIENEIALKTLQSKERLSYLQEQINPHFLYNTLNSIGIMGADVGDDRIYDSCQMLARVLKYAITEKESSYATFEEELENTERYLQLMKLRFEDKLKFQIFCEEEVKKQKTLRIVLQPFVENIFEHGFDASHRELSIVIRGYIRNGNWIISIMDNGAGMPEKALEEMKLEIAERIKQAKSPEPLKENENIGIKNTLVRMALYYGDSFRYSVNNLAGGGFIVTLEGKEGEIS